MEPKYIPPDKIEQIANEIRRDSFGSQSETEVFDIDVNVIVEKLGCKIEVVDFDPPDISARVLRTTDCLYTIQISKKDNLKRQKFSIAHEIAHILLHDDGSDEFIEMRRPQIDYSPLELYKEVQANMLAAAILLPSVQVKLIWESSKSIDAISEVFNVSREAAYNRLLNLGLLEDE